MKDFDNEDWEYGGLWECPKCGSEHEDPGSITITTCKNGHVVYLSFSDEKGKRTAYYES